MGSDGQTRSTRWMVGGLWLVVAVLSIGATLQGCATQSAHQIQEQFVATKHRTVHIEPCQDRTGFTGDRDLAAEATATLNEKVKASKFFKVTTEASLLLTCDIERFAEGSSLKRWVWPGWGATQAGVVVMVWEIPGDKVLATLRSQSSVKTGGFYTMGADQYILRVAFDDIVKQLEAWSMGTGPETGP